MRDPACFKMRHSSTGRRSARPVGLCSSTPGAVSRICILHQAGRAGTPVGSGVNNNFRHSWCRDGFAGAAAKTIKY